MRVKVIVEETNQSKSSVKETSRIAKVSVPDLRPGFQSALTIVQHRGNGVL